jgi:hypothetical protein
MDERRTVLPIAIARLVQERKDHDIEGELRVLFNGGRRHVTIGLGPEVDVPLLDEELHAAMIAEIDREIVVASVHVEADGFMVERGWSNFGLYVWNDLDPIWQSVPWQGTVRGLRPGDKVALGSTPADALQFTLPECAVVAPRTHRRSARLEQADSQRRARAAPRSPGSDRPTPDRPAGAGTPLRATPRGGAPIRPDVARTPGGTPYSSPRPAPLRVDSDRYQRRFDNALKYWRYAMISIGSDDSCVVVLDDPDLAPLRAALGRNLENPERGYELFVKNPDPELWVQPAGQGAKLLSRGDFVKLKGGGNRLGFAGYVVQLPDPAAPIPRFGTLSPTPGEIAEVLGVDTLELDDPDVVKSAHRELVLRFHPDRHGGDPGHLSRFYEVQACFEAWKKLHSG